MKRKIKPAAKIFIALLIVGTLFYCKYLFIDSKKGPDKPQIAHADSTKVDSVTVNSVATVSVATNTVAAQNVPAAIASTPVQVQAPVKTNTGNVKTPSVVKKSEEHKTKEKKSTDRENLNVNF